MLLRFSPFFPLQDSFCKTLAEFSAELKAQ